MSTLNNLKCSLTVSLWLWNSPDTMHLVKEVKKRKHVTHTTGELMYSCVCVCVQYFWEQRAKVYRKCFLHKRQSLYPHASKFNTVALSYPVFFFLSFLPWMINYLQMTDDKTAKGMCNRRHVARHDTTVVYFLTSSTVSGSGAVTKIRKLSVAIYTTEQSAIAGES